MNVLLLIMIIILLLTNIYYVLAISHNNSNEVRNLHEEQFTQYQAIKYTTTLKNISNFKTLQINAEENIIQVKLNQYGGTFILTDKSLYICDDYNNLQANCQDIYKMKNSTKSKLVILNNNNNNNNNDIETNHNYYIALVDIHGIVIFKCTSTSSLSTSATACDLYKINMEQHFGTKINAIDATTTNIIIASDDGLYSISIASIIFISNENNNNIISWYKPDPCNATSNNKTNVYEVKCANDVTCLASTDICLSWINVTKNGDLYKHEWTGGLIDHVANCITFTSPSSSSKSIWVGTKFSLNQYETILINDDNNDYTTGLWKRMAGKPGEDGLPVRATCKDIAASVSNDVDGDGTINILLATSKGLVIYRPSSRSTNRNRIHNNKVEQEKGDEFDFLTSPRWLTTINSNEPVLSIDISNDGNIILASTKYGISVIEKITWTLEDKANYYQTEVIPRHFRPVTNLISSLNLQTFGDINSAMNNEPDDNHGLWTAQYLATQSFRYKVTGDENAYKEAMKALSTLEVLMNVTGTKGFPARTMTENGKYKTNSHWGWNESPTREGWWFIANTSSDEITGHVFGYSIFLDHAAKNENDRNRALYLLESIVLRIINDGFVLKDITGLTTHWGVWAPKDLNGEFGWSDERGLNSLQMLSYLFAALKHSTNQKNKDIYTNALLELLNEENHYHINILNQKITAPSEINFSDNELSFKPYYVISNACGYGIFSTKNDRNEMGADNNNNNIVVQKDEICQMFLPYYENSLERAFRILKKEKCPEYSFIYNASRKSVKSTSSTSFSSTSSKWIADAFHTLETYPIDLIIWPVNNNGRLDLPIDVAHQPYINRSLVLIPRHQSAALRWSFNPFVFIAGDGAQEEDPTFWLLSYWMGRLHSEMV